MMLRQSEWSYNTGATGGVSIDFVMASGGTIVLNDPSKREQDFYYGGIGVGLGVGFKIPKIRLPKLTLPEIKVPKVGGRAVGGAASEKSFTSIGWVYLTPGFKNTELTREDIQGGTVYVDASVGIIAGGGGSAMLLGINTAKLALGLSNPGMSWLAEEAILDAPAVLLMGGYTAGLQAGFGAGLMIGYLH